MSRLAAMTCLAIVLAFSPASECQKAQDHPDYSVAVESPLVLVDVLVTDEDGNVITGLKNENFRLLDNGKAQIITSFGSTSTSITIVMLIEYSGLAYNYFAYKSA